MAGRNCRPNVLYICIDSTLGGSTLSLLYLIESVRDSVNPIVLFPNKGIAYDFFVNHGIECYVYPFVILYKFTGNRLIDVWHHPWRWHPIKKQRLDFECGWFLKKKLKGRKIDIVHTNTSPNDVGVFLSRFFGAKHVWHVRECLDDHAQYRMYGGLEKLIRKINNADVRIAISSYVRDHWKMNKRNTFLIHDAICSKNESTCILPKEKYVLFISYNLTEAKGSRIAIMAFGLSQLNNDGFKLVLMGNCNIDYQASLMATAKDYHCDKDIVFLPCQRNIKPVFEKAAAMVMASKYEGLGRVTAEAMFYGCPVIAHASGGTLDIVQDGKTGYLFSEVDDCAELLRKVCLTDQESIIRQAQKFAMENLSTDNYGDQILGVYHYLLS